VQASGLTIDDVREKLQAMQDDPAMMTRDAYSPAATEWPGSRMPFIEIHLAYLQKHKLVNPEHYLSNLALMIKTR
jgi:hypothetical protein